jgi:hypothetical protein
VPANLSSLWIWSRENFLCWNTPRHVCSSLRRHYQVYSSDCGIVCKLWCDVQREGELERVQCLWKVQRFQRTRFYLLHFPSFCFSCRFEWVWNLVSSQKAYSWLRVSENMVRGSCLGSRRQQQTGENNIMTSFLAYKLQKLYFVWSHIGGWDGWGVWHAWRGREKHVSVWY